MQNNVKQDEFLTPEAQDVMKYVIAAIRIVKVYPPNNPIYSQSIKKAFESLSLFLTTGPEYRLGVQKNFFTYQQTPFGKDTQVNKSIAQDLFVKGIREVLFAAHVTEQELITFFRALSLSPEELAIRSGIASILWEEGVTHIKVTESGLDEIVTTKTGDTATGSASGSDASGDGKQDRPAGKTLMLADARTDPAGFGAGMVAFALKTKSPQETVEDRLFSLYQQAGKKIMQDHSQDSDTLFEGLAKSVLAIEPGYRDRLVAGKLYGDLDAELALFHQSDQDQQLPNAFHEIQTGRFANLWTVEQVSSLLKRTVTKKVDRPVPQPAPADLKAEPISPELPEIAKSLEADSPERMENLKEVTGAGMESDVIEFAVHTLIDLIPLVQNPFRSQPEKEKLLFSGVISQLEDILGYLLQKNNYELATLILKAFQMPVPAEFQPRIAEAVKKTATKSIIISTITDMRKHPQSSPAYQAAYSYLSNLERKATGVLLELLSEETDRDLRIFLLDLLKDFGRNQITLLGEHLSDLRWYVVRNVVSILAESKTDQAIALLRRAADHKNVQIRQEVIKALTSTGGRKAAAVLSRFLSDEDVSIQLMAINAYADFPGIVIEDSTPLLEYLHDRPIGRKEQENSLAAITTLGKIGGSEAALFLGQYPRARWWKSRKLQRELREASRMSVNEITRRQHHGDSAR